MADQGSSVTEGGISTLRQPYPARFRPGPWSIRRGFSGTLLIRGPRDDAVCVLGVVKNELRLVERNANARLIVAAPTMAAYIRKRAVDGDAEAAAIWEEINATTPTPVVTDEPEG